MIRTPRFWQHRGPLSVLLWPLSVPYRLGAWIDRSLTQPRRAPLPVIAIGNATAGGAGKTPTAIALAAMLQAMGEIPHIISRGYGGAKHMAHRVDPTRDSATDVGDEALLLARAAPNWVGADRLASARAAHAAGATVIIADDALQHHRLQHDVAMLVVDAQYAFGNQFLLPAGPLREPLRGVMARADFTVLIGDSTTPLPNPSLGGDRVAASIAIRGGTDWLRANNWLAFAGIAHPEKFYATLRGEQAVLVATESFADHQPISPDTLSRLRDKAATLDAKLITTEKDFLRIPASQRDGIAVLPIHLQWRDAASLQQSLTQMLASARA